MKIEHSNIPSRRSGRRVVIDEKELKAILADLAGSQDFEPHAYTDGESYETSSKALSQSSIVIRNVAHATGKSERWLARRTWEANGVEDRKKKGDWRFAVSWRSEEAPKRTRKQKQTAAA